MVLRQISSRRDYSRETVLERLKVQVRELLRDAPGQRFQRRYHRVHETGGIVVLRKILFIGGGVLVVCAGLFFLPAPGPGMVIIAIGATMMAQESLAVAKVLDWLEVKGRKATGRLRKSWRGMSTALRMSIVAATAAVVLTAAWLSFSAMFR